jgi:oxygen-independent coproporphyrinogen-3 oxidase
MTDPIAVYVHVPFCPTKCGYCDFNSYAMDGEIVERTAAAIAAEIRRSPWRGRPAKTIFFGGGTPTFLREETLVGLLKAVMEVHPPIEGCEITSEANPGTVDAGKFRAMRSGGFNRVSLGAQSFVDRDLIVLGRVHRGGEIERAVSAAREAGFDNLNLDLMFALPDQSRHAWRSNLDRALALRPEHISLYCLTIEPNTAFYKQNLRGLLALPDDEAQTEMYEDCLARTAEAGFVPYEISNFALPGYECRHNLEYWTGGEYAAYGPGAVGMVREFSLNPTPAPPQGEGFYAAVRYTNLKHPVGYSEKVEAGMHPAYDVEPLTEADLRTERIMLGLRLDRGIREEGLDERSVRRLEGRGWLEPFEGGLRLTPAGRHFHSEAAAELI